MIRPEESILVHNRFTRVPNIFAETSTRNNLFLVQRIANRGIEGTYKMLQLRRTVDQDERPELVDDESSIELAFVSESVGHVGEIVADLLAQGDCCFLARSLLEATDFVAMGDAAAHAHSDEQNNMAATQHAHGHR